MKINVEGSGNSITLGSILTLCTLYQSNLGGPGSQINTILFLFVLLFIVLNFKLDQFLVMGFFLPALFVLLSVCVNHNLINSNGYHTIFLLMESFFLLTLSSVTLNKKLLKFLIIIYLSICLCFSLFYSLDPILNGVPNTNFNGNPNSASLFFFVCLLLSNFFLKSKIRWLYMISFFVLILTTASRSGFIVAGMFLLLLGLFDANNDFDLDYHFYISKGFYRSLAILMSMIGFIYLIIPNVFTNLLLRLTANGLNLNGTYIGNHGRDEIWKLALMFSNDSLTSMLFGLSPGRIVDLINSGTHSSYIEAVVSFGWLFLVATLFFIACLLYYHIKKGQFFYICMATLVLIYGAFEVCLFNGFSLIWWLFIFISLYYRSAESEISNKNSIIKGKLASC